jgi:hypothetical protein
MKHTPGPWKYDGAQGAGSIVTDTQCIAVIEDDGGYEAPLEEREANAHLLAAAPALLAACKAFMELWRDCDMRPEDECHEVAGIIREAIAEAEKPAA